MRNYIAAGFQNTVDFELNWDASVLETLISQYKITSSEISAEKEIHSERDLIIVLLAHMMSGSGSECLADSSCITRAFASHFKHQITLGGTAVRAAMAIEKTGYRSSIHVCSLNHYFRSLIPKAINWTASVPDEGDDFHPHVIIQYPAHSRIKAMDIDFETSRANRVIFTHDPPSMLLRITDSFIQKLKHTRVLLIASYNIIQDEEILKNRLEHTIRIINSLPSPHTVIMEDGCFKNPHMRRTVTETLSGYIDIFSINEDELQDRFGRKINLSDPVQTANAVRTVYSKLHVPTLICHSSRWTLAYGNITENIRSAIKSGILMAATRFRLGNDYDESDYEETEHLPDSREGKIFSEYISRRFQNEPFLCLPGKDLSFVQAPTTIGLGDSFAGGMLPCFLPGSLSEEARFR